MSFHVSLLADAQMVEIVRYGADEGDSPGSVKNARFLMAGQTFLCTDSIVKHAFTFTPIHLTLGPMRVRRRDNRLQEASSAGRAVPMPIGKCGFGKSFAWMDNRFGSWQLNLE